MTNKQSVDRSGKATPQSTTSKSIWTKSFVIALIAVLALGAISLSTGVYDILGEEDGRDMFFITRIPRTAALMLAGAAMSICGLVMQLITQNRFVEPTTTGTIEWAGLGLLAVYVLVPAPTLLQRMVGAIVFSFVGTMVFFLSLRRVRMKSSLVVPLVGIMLGAVVSAVSTFVGLAFSMTQSLETWFQGSFAPVQRGKYEFLWAIVAVTIVVYLFADRLTVVGLGQDIAKNLGLDYNQVLVLATGLVSLSVGIVSAVIGNVPFIGLIVPNLVSMMRGDHLKGNLPWVALMGMGTITLSDILARVVIMPFEIPVSLILGTFGAAVFIVLLARQRRPA